jgi:Uma2 family endonuclease
MAGTTTERAIFEVPAWLPPDTEESVVGTQWHQEAVDALATMLREVGRRHGTPWGIARGIALLDPGRSQPLGLPWAEPTWRARYPDGKPYDPKPDVIVLARPLPTGDIAGVSLADVGIPLFIGEVASKSTLGNDMGFKKDVYEFVGVPEYIVFDATGSLIAPALHAWHLEEGAYVPWVADDDGWWRSRSLGISFQPTQPFMTIRDREGRQLSLPHQAFEREYTLERVEHELVEAQRRIAEMEAQLRALRGDGTSGESGDVSPP